MSRSGYVEDCDDEGYLRLGRWRAQVESAIRGKRGQRLLFDLVTALDAMPEKRLIENDLERPPSVSPEGEWEGGVCALGAVAKLRSIDVSALIDAGNPDDHEELGEIFGVARQLVAEVMYENDEASRPGETPEQRWGRMRRWALRNLLPETLIREEAANV